MRTEGRGGDTEWVKVSDRRIVGWKMEEGGKGEDDGEQGDEGKMMDWRVLNLSHPGSETHPYSPVPGLKRRTPFQ